MPPLPYRVVFSIPHFLGSPRPALRGRSLYPEAEQLEIFMALRNPATFLPALFATTACGTRHEVLRGCDPP
ncbi:hypothetical protein [Leisingera sp. JC11]|uniref:hypothetical protein n=1 Tax=Leisingera sp. JC11 TaxID=3042469 RepID=UPI003453B18B